jgi:DNA adenine methylase
MQPYDWGDAPKPFLKWVGSKRFLLPEILRRLPKKMNAYYEPFLGGGAVFFALAAEGRFKKAVLSDANAELVATYNALADEVDAVIERLHEHVYDKTHYYAVRAHEPRSLPAKAARMIYLNRTCFNGLYRVNQKGHFNVPFGRYTNPTICDEGNLRAVSKVLKSKGVSVLVADFVDAVKKAHEGDVVYFDPPYVPLSTTSDFTTFTKGGFGTADQVRLRDCFKSLEERGVHVLLSNSDAPMVRELYKGFRVSKVKAPRRVNSKGNKRGDVGELIISSRRTP